jgi:hypothetical protein
VTGMRKKLRHNGVFYRVAFRRMRTRDSRPCLHSLDDLLVGIRSSRAGGLQGAHMNGWHSGLSDEEERSHE